MNVQNYYLENAQILWFFFLICSSLNHLPRPMIIVSFMRLHFHTNLNFLVVGIGTISWKRIHLWLVECSISFPMSLIWWFKNHGQQILLRNSMVALYLCVPSVTVGLTSSRWSGGVWSLITVVVVPTPTKILSITPYDNPLRDECILSFLASLVVNLASVNPATPK